VSTSLTKEITLPQFNIIETATEKTVKTFEAPEEYAMVIAADWSRGQNYDVGDLKVVEVPRVEA
jgi:hypothetical protein